MAAIHTWTEDTARAEVSYIESIDPHYPGGAFDNSTECFIRYLTMQSVSLRAAGFKEYAADVVHFTRLAAF